MCHGGLSCIPYTGLLQSRLQPSTQPGQWRVNQQIEHSQYVSLSKSAFQINNKIPIQNKMGRSHIQYKKNYLSEWNLPTLIQGIATGGLCNHHCNPVLFLILSVTMYIANENGSRSSPTWSLWPRTILWEPPSCRSVPLIRIWDPTVRSPTISWPVT